VDSTPLLVSSHFLLFPLFPSSPHSNPPLSSSPLYSLPFVSRKKRENKENGDKRQMGGENKRRDEREGEDSRDIGNGRREGEGKIGDREGKERKGEWGKREGRA
jgi:hypothetical protein